MSDRISHENGGTVRARLYHRAFAAAILMLIAGALVAIGWNSGRDESVLPPCPTHEYLGFYCPGCGSTRGIACLLRGDLAGAWRFNPGMVVLGAPALLVGVAGLLSVVVRGHGLRLPAVPGWAGWMLGIAVVLYAVARNVPGPMFDWLRPPERGVLKSPGSEASAGQRSGTDAVQQ